MTTTTDALDTAELARRLGVRPKVLSVRIARDPGRYGAAKLTGAAARHYPARPWEMQPSARWVVPAWAEAVLRRDIFGEGDGS